jgi:hypothetical protein
MAKQIKLKNKIDTKLEKAIIKALKDDSVWNSLEAFAKDLGKEDLKACKEAKKTFNVQLTNLEQSKAPWMRFSGLLETYSNLKAFYVNVKTQYEIKQHLDDTLCCLDSVATDKDLYDAAVVAHAEATAEYQEMAAKQEKEEEKLKKEFMKWKENTHGK